MVDGLNLQGRSGRVALPRMKVVLAMVEAFLMLDAARREERSAGAERKMAEDMIVCFSGSSAASRVVLEGQFVGL